MVPPSVADILPQHDTILGLGLHFKGNPQPAFVLRIIGIDLRRLGQDLLARQWLEQARRRGTRWGYMCFNRMLADALRASIPEAEADIATFQRRAISALRRQATKPPSISTSPIPVPSTLRSQRSRRIGIGRRDSTDSFSTKPPI